MLIDFAKLVAIEPLYQMTDVRLPNATFQGDEFDIGHGAGSTGILSSFGPFLASRFDDAMKLIVDRSEKSDMTVPVNPKLVLSQPYHPAKLRDAIEKGLSTEPPVVDLEALHIPTVGVVYRVTNGIHRSFAARYYGMATIDARVRKIHYCNPKAYFLDGRSLCRIHSNRCIPVSPDSPLGPEVSIGNSLIPIDVIAILQSVGCPSHYVSEI